MAEHYVTIDDLFLPVLFLVFISGLTSVFAANYYLKPSKTTAAKWSIWCLYLLSSVSFLGQLRKTWMRDFLHQFELVTEPVLWQRRLADFILAHKLTLDTTENYWITSQLLLFTLSFVVFINMYSKDMDLKLHHIFGYIALGLTSSFGGVLALVLVHFCQATSATPFVAKVTTGRFYLQVLSTVLGCAIVVYLYNASLVQVNTIMVLFLATTFLLPFANFSIQGIKPIYTTSTSIFFFLIFLGAFITLHHIIATFMVAHEWLNFKMFSLVAFGAPYQLAISVDLICCTIIVSTFVILELFALKTLQLKFKNSGRYVFKLLLLFFTCPVILILTFIISPGAMLSLFLAYREKVVP
ncbi:uncharacterized protein LOC114524059 [Dendronephthya gigantea]|uniref:uncharacterized protein LOC114524059 n=1 Tax=Dendronephthya gigantea TaxID=151771 RepID=UPI00106D18CE|nr:uncharacterized protein LOC114524059 [Dendronephthya gigantea]